MPEPIVVRPESVPELRNPPALEPDLALARDAEPDPLKKEIWAKMSALKGELATLELRQKALQDQLEKVKQRKEYAEAQFKCLRGFVEWDKFAAQQAKTSYDESDPQHYEMERALEDMREIERGPQS